MTLIFFHSIPGALGRSAGEIYVGLFLYGQWRLQIEMLEAGKKETILALSVVLTGLVLIFATNILLPLFVYWAVTLFSLTLIIILKIKQPDKRDIQERSKAVANHMSQEHAYTHNGVPIGICVFSVAVLLTFLDKGLFVLPPGGQTIEGIASLVLSTSLILGFLFLSRRVDEGRAIALSFVAELVGLAVRGYGVPFLTLLGASLSSAASLVLLLAPFMSSTPLVNERQEDKESSSVFGSLLSKVQTNAVACFWCLGIPVGFMIADALMRTPFMLTPVELSVLSLGCAGLVVLCLGMGNARCVQQEALPSADGVDPAMLAVSDKLGLTNREREIFMELQTGYTQSEIRNKLGISLSTIETHVRHIYQKAGVHSRDELLILTESMIRSLRTGKTQKSVLRKGL